MSIRVQVQVPATFNATPEYYFPLIIASDENEGTALLPPRLLPPRRVEHGPAWLETKLLPLCWPDPPDPHRYPGSKRPGAANRRGHINSFETAAAVATATAASFYTYG